METDLLTLSSGNVDWSKLAMDEYNKKGKKMNAKLFAQFMGGYNHDPDTAHMGTNLPFRNDDWYGWSDMNFDTSWDWIMPVWEKFRKLHFEINEVSDRIKFAHHCQSISYAITNEGLAAANTRLSNGIKWYNETIKKSL